MWKAQIQIGDEALPVKLYAAAQDRKVHFRLLHGEDLAPVHQEMVDPIEQRKVAKEEILRGIEVDEGIFAIITNKEQQELEPEPSRDIHVTQFVRPACLAMEWLDRPYYLGPDGDEPGYFALAEALDERQRVGTASWVMRKKKYHGALLSRDGYLLLQTLRNQEDLVSLDALRAPSDRAPSAKEEELAKQLLATLEGHFDVADYHDEHQAQIRKLIAAKAAGTILQLPNASSKAKSRSLLEDLEASVAKGVGSGR